MIILSSWGFSQPKKEYHDAAQTQLKSETDYLKGMPHGTHLEYYKNGRVSRKGFFNYGKEDSVWTFYYEDGKKKAIENFMKGKKWGTNKYYFKSGKIAQVTKYENDLSDSVWTAYYENGNVKSKETFELGKKEGEWIYYYENGQKKRECHNVDLVFGNSYEKGLCKEWNERGELIYEGIYVEKDRKP